MPRLPDASDLSAPNFRATRQAVDVPVANYQQAFGALGQGIANVGEAAQKYAQEKDDRAKKQEMFDARMAGLKAEQEHYERIKGLDPLDPQFPDKVKQSYQQAYRPVISGLRYPENRQAVELASFDNFVNVGIKAKEEQRKAFGEKTLLDLDTLKEDGLQRIARGEDPAKVMADIDQATNEAQYIDGIAKEKVGKENRTALITGALNKKSSDLYAGKGGPLDKAAVLVRGFEGFRDTPYMDVNRYRVGYGSDTITTADGKVVQVVKGMKISREDAERDLKRRVGEFQEQAAKDAGPAWNNLTPDQQAALTSVAYNYGSLPKRVVEAIQTGDTANIARSVQSLADHNSGINYNRRMQEAAIIAGGKTVQPSKDDVIAAVQNDPLYRQLPVDRAEELTSNLITKFKKAEEEDKAAKAFETVTVSNLVKDDLASIEATGTGISDLTYERVANATNDKTAVEWATSRREAEATYAATAEMSSMKNADLEVFASDNNPYRPRANDTDFSARQRIFEKTQNRAKELLSARDKDPVTAAISAVPKLKEAWASFNPNDRDNARTVLNMTVEAQRSLGIPEKKIVPLPVDQAKSIADAIGNEKNTPDQRIASLVSAITLTADPQHQEQILRQLVKSGVSPQMANVVEAWKRSDTGAARRLFQAATLTAEKTLLLGSADNKINTAVEDALFGDVGQAFYGFDLGDPRAAEVASSDLSLAKAAVRLAVAGGMSQDEAISQTMSDIFGPVETVDLSLPSGGYVRGIAEKDIDQDALEAGFDAARGKMVDVLQGYIARSSGAIPADAAPETRAIFNAAHANELTRILNDGVWRNNGDGWSLFDPANRSFVSDDEGRPIKFSTDDILAMGKTNGTKASNVTPESTGMFGTDAPMLDGNGMLPLGDAQ